MTRHPTKGGFEGNALPNTGVSHVGCGILQPASAKKRPSTPKRGQGRTRAFQRFLWVLGVASPHAPRIEVRLHQLPIAGALLPQQRGAQAPQRQLRQAQLPQARGLTADAEGLAQAAGLALAGLFLLQAMPSV